MGEFFGAAFAYVRRLNFQGLELSEILLGSSICLLPMGMVDERLHISFLCSFTWCLWGGSFGSFLRLLCISWMDGMDQWMD